MKTAFTLLLLLIMLQPAIAQTGLGTTNPASCSVLDLTSTSKGFLPPRMSWSQIQAIPLPAPGLTVYDNGIGALRVYTSKGWTVLAPRAQGFYDPPGNFSSTTQAAGTGNVVPLTVKNSRLNPANVYVSGYFGGTAIIGGQIISSTSTYSTYFAKFDSTGTALWIKVIGANSFTLPYSMDLDVNDNVYLGGTFGGTIDFDPGAGVANLTSSGTSDAFYARYDAGGNYKWAKAVGGTAAGEFVRAVSCYGSNVVVAGSFSGSGFFNGATLSGGGIFIGKYDTSTGNLSGQDWVKQITDPTYLEITSVRAASNVIFVGGNYSGTMTFPGGATRSTSSIQAGFVGVLDQTGNPIFAPMMDPGANAVASVDHITTDAAGNVYVCGRYSGTPNLDMSGATSVPAPASVQDDAYIVKWTFAYGYPLGWSATINGPGSENAYHVVVDAANNVTVNGRMTAPLTFSNGITIPGEGNGDFFMTHYNASGVLQWVKNAGSSGDDQACGLDVSPNGKIIWFGGQIATAPFLDFNSTKISATGFFLSKYEE